MRIGYPRRAGLAAAAIGLSAALVACGSSTGPGGPDGSGQEGSASDTATLTVYTDQHADLVKALTDEYTRRTGIKFKIQNDATVGQIQAEGRASKVDVFLSEDPTPVAQLGADGLLAPIEQSTLNQVRPGLSSQKGYWVAYAARARVLYYNPTLIAQDQLPKTLADITDPQYKGKFAWAPSGAFVATTQYLIATQGQAKTKTFLQAIKANGVNEQKNGNVRDTVEAGKHAMGLSNHYYWWVLAAEKGGPDKLSSKIYHFPTTDPGNLVLSSGAGVLKASKHRAEAQKFIAWVTSKDGGQTLIATAPANVSEAQYPVAPGLASSIAGDLSEVKSPSFDMDELADASQAEDLLKQLGMSKG
jgi:iron(III) transport system substrate-binding protein